MRLLVNQQLVPFPMRSKSISLEQSCYEKSQATVVTSQYYLLFRRLKTKTKADLEKCFPFSISIAICLNINFFFSQIIFNINNLIALRSTNQITEILHLNAKVISKLEKSNFQKWQNSIFNGPYIAKKTFA